MSSSDWEEPQNSDEDSDILEVVTALSDFRGLGANELSFGRGDAISVLQKTTDHWWWAAIGAKYGYIPVNHVRSEGDETREGWQDDEYYDSYGALKLQHEMLSDVPRTLAYRTAIEQHASWISGKVVLDVGCGTGVLSLFCAKLGHASKVYAVEGSTMAELAKVLVKENGEGGVITVINQRLEEVTLPEQVDLIISEWMGTALLFEFMIESVIVARDRWLSPGGVMWPSVAKLHMVPCTAEEVYQEKVEFWEERYGIDLTPLRDKAIDEFFYKPLYNHEMKESDGLAKSQALLEITMATVTISDIEVIERLFSYQVIQSGKMHGFCCWFSIDFGGMPEALPPSINGHDPSADAATATSTDTCTDTSLDVGCGTGPTKEVVSLDTGPSKPLTHWKQALFMMDSPTVVVVGDVVSGTIKMVRNPEWRRHLHVTLTFSVHSKDNKQDFTKRFLLWR